MDTLSTAVRLVEGAGTQQWIYTENKYRLGGHRSMCVVVRVGREMREIDTDLLVSSIQVRDGRGGH